MLSSLLALHTTEMYMRSCGISWYYRFKVAQMYFYCTMFQPTTKPRNYRIYNVELNLLTSVVSGN